MTKYIFKPCIVLALILCCFAAESRAQNPRETEWQNYKLPSSDFARYTDANKVIVFRVPVEWKQQGGALIFKGDENIEYKRVVQVMDMAKQAGLPKVALGTRLPQD